MPLRATAAGGHRKNNGPDTPLNLLPDVHETIESPGLPLPKRQEGFDGSPRPISTRSTMESFEVAVQG